jgi:hypothetical protein
MTVASTLTTQLTSERDAARAAVASTLTAQQAGSPTTADVRLLLREAALKDTMITELAAALA